MKPGPARTFLFVGLPIAAGAIGLVYVAMEAQRFLTTSERFAVRRVEIETKGRADNEELKRLAGVSPGTNIFSIDLTQTRKNIERDPWVHDATVTRELPNKIEITYRSQEPKAILGADSMYYLNAEGVPFYRVQKGDNLKFPLIQVDGKATDKELLKSRVAEAVKILDRIRKSPLFHDQDLGDMTVSAESDEAPYLLTLRYPPKALPLKTAQPSRLYTASLGDEDLDRQVKHWEVVVRHLAQAGKTPRLIRLELGKKVVVKLEK